MLQTNTTKGVAIAVALGFAGLIGGFGGFLLILFLGLIGGLVGAQLDGTLDVRELYGRISQGGRR